MLKLWVKLATMRAETGIEVKEIAKEINVARQTVTSWRKRKPQIEHAKELVKKYPKYITLKDCGH